jgi:hypothetical protein
MFKIEFPPDSVFQGIHTVFVPSGWEGKAIYLDWVAYFSTSRIFQILPPPAAAPVLLSG